MKREMHPELVRALRYFTREKEIMSGLLLVCEAGGRTETVMDGDVRADSVFDLASLTKLFTSLLLMRLYEQGKIDLDAPVERCAPAFSHLDGLTVRQAAWYEKAVRTPERIDTVVLSTQHAPDVPLEKLRAALGEEAAPDCAEIRAALSSRLLSSCSERIPAASVT